MPFITDIDFERSDKLREMLRSEGVSEKAWGTITTALAEVREITERAAQPEETPKRIGGRTRAEWTLRIVNSTPFGTYTQQEHDSIDALIAAAFGKE